MGSLGEAAAAYAEAGFRVFPIWGVRPDGSCLCPRAASCDSAGKHPHGRLVPHGLSQATDDAEQVAAWWRQAPQSNVGLATGGTFFVLDVDGDAGRESYARLLEDLELRDLEAPIATTGGGGFHAFLGKDEEVHVRNQQGVLWRGARLPGLDVRGDGGYVVAPPSRHASGGTYEWARGDLDCVHGAPPALLSALAGDPGATAPEVPTVPRNAPERSTPTHSHPPLPTPARAAAPSEREVPEEEVEQIRAALEVIPPNEAREFWLERVSMPLHDHFGGSQQGYALWLAWCRRGEGMVTPNGNRAFGGERECWKVWRSFSASHRNPKGIATFWAHAQHHGWRPPAGAPPANGSPPATMPLPGRPAPPSEDERLELGPWREPEPLRDVEDHPRLDVDRAFPPELHWLRDFVKAISRLLQVPVEFPAVLAAGLASGAYGRVFQVRLGGTGWVEYPPIWVICAFASGAGKSPVFRPLVQPFRQWDAAVDQKAEFDDWEARRDLAKVMLFKAQGHAKKQAEKARENPPVMSEVRSRLLEARRELTIAEESRPRSRRVLASSLTTPALVEFLQNHQERCLLADPEGSVFQHVLGGRTDYDKDVDPWCKAFSCEPILQNRVGDAHRAKERRVEAPCLSMALCTQVTSLSLFRDDYAEGKGFLARFIPVMFRRRLPDVALVEGRLPAELAERWRAKVWSLLSLEVPEHEPRELVLEGAAAAVFKRWQQDWLDEAHADEAADALSPVGYDSAAAAKVRSYCLRIVMLLHVLGCDYPAETPIDPELVRTVCDVWMPFVRTSVGQVLGLVRDDPDLRVAERLLAWIARADVAEFSRADAFRNLKSRGVALQVVAKVNDLNGALAMLVDAGWIQPLTRPKHRGPYVVAAASRYAVHEQFSEHFARTPYSDGV
jgi:hypothetical protein